MSEWSVIRQQIRQLTHAITNGEAAPANRSAEEWICTFDGRAGGHARAVFKTKDLARQFAERHVRAVTPAGTRLKWEDTNDATMLSTLLGDYLVAPATAG